MSLQEEGLEPREERTEGEPRGGSGGAQDRGLGEDAFLLFEPPAWWHIVPASRADYRPGAAVSVRGCNIKVSDRKREQNADLGN